ncbi:hypothetical protein MW887_008098 [Aspergillus wentii]|nr:hypothetical protein MW887_008098 [Aspergillus wentii]
MTSYRPFSCELCYQSFTRSENLERHKQTRMSANDIRSDVKVDLSSANKCKWKSGKIKIPSRLNGQMKIRCPSQSYSKEEQVTCANWRRKAWEDGYDELSNLTSSDWKELGKTWVIQAWLLHIIYGAYLGDGSHYEMAKQMLRSLVDAIRELGVLQQSTAFPLATSWIAQSKRSPLRSESQPLQECWMAYVNEESMRLSLYVLLFLDTQISSPCNLRPLISPIEFGWELPYSSSLWEANNAHNWLQRLSDEYLGPSTSPYGELHLERGKATSSLSLATQELMSECPSPGLLATLQASPFATLCVLTNLDQLVRDFTRCYYQLPPNLSDPSAFHILTQSQNRQVMAAIRIVTKMVQQPPKPSQALLWHAIELMTFSIKVSLCQPDELLIGGVVDTSLVAGLATATHLTLGSYVAVRRSAPFRLQQKSKDDGALSIISELLTGLSRIMAVEELGFAAREAPWATVASFRMLLMIWQVLRRATSEIRKHIKAENKAPEKFEPSMLIFSALMEALVGFAADETRYSRDSDVLSSLDESEALFMKIIFRICQSRSVWGIGDAMEKLMEEIKVE